MENEKFFMNIGYKRSNNILILKDLPRHFPDNQPLLVLYNTYSIHSQPPLRKLSFLLIFRFFHKPTKKISPFKGSYFRATPSNEQEETNIIQ